MKPSTVSFTRGRRFRAMVAGAQCSTRVCAERSRSWLNVEYRYGSTGIEATYTELLNGTANPSAGFICIPSAEDSSG